MQGDDSTNTDHGQPVLITEWVLIGLSCVTVIARFIFKAIKFRKLSYDDYSMAIAAVLVVLHGVSIIKAHQHGWGRHEMYLSSYDNTEATKYIFFTQGLGYLSAMFGRVSFCLFMVVMTPVTELMKIILYLLIGLQLFINVVTTILIYAQCSDAAALWDTSITTAVCIDHSIMTDLGWCQAIFNCVTDLSLTTLAAVMVWNLRHLPSRIRAGFAVLLCLSSFAFVANVIRTCKLDMLVTHHDLPWDSVPFILWTSIEVNTIIIAASIHTLFRQSDAVVDAVQVLPTHSIEITHVRQPSSAGLAHRIAQKGRSMSVGLTFSLRRYSRDNMMTAGGLDGNESQEEILGGKGHAVLIMKTREVKIDTLQQNGEIRLETPIVPTHLRQGSDRTEAMWSDISSGILF